MHRGLGRTHPKEFYRRSTDASKHHIMAQDKKNLQRINILKKKLIKNLFKK